MVMLLTYCPAMMLVTTVNLGGGGVVLFRYNASSGWQIVVDVGNAQLLLNHVI